MTTQTRIVAHENAGRRYLLVEVPGGSYAYKVFNDDDPYLSVIMRTSEGIQTPRFYLPPGKWSILGIAGELESVEDIVEGFDSPTGGDDYQDYYRCYEGPQGDEDWPWIAGDPEASFNSLLSHHYLTPANCLVLREEN